MRTFRHEAMWLAVLALSVTAVVGCGKTEQASKKAVEPAVATETADWLTLKAKDGSVSIKVPKGWVPGDPNDPEYKRVLGDLAKTNPQLKQIASQSSNALLIGLRADPKVVASGFVDNININRTDAGGKTEISDQDMADAKKEFGAKLPLEGPLNLERTTVPAGEGLRYTADIKFMGPAGKAVITHLIGYMILHEGNLFTVTYASGGDRGKEMEEIAAKSIQTLAF